MWRASKTADRGTSGGAVDDRWAHVMEQPTVDQRTRQRQRRRNIAQTILLLGGMVAALAVVGWLVLGTAGFLWILVIGGILVVAQPRVPTRWILSMYGAIPLPERAAPELHRIVRVLAERAGLPAVPTLYYVASSMANAFAVGRRHDAAMAVTDGLVRKLTARQVAGVLAHETSHVLAGDTTVMSLADAISRFVQFLSYLGILLFIAGLPMTAGGEPRLLLAALVLLTLPTVVTLLQLGLSRSREYDADLEGAALTGDPDGLASALETLERTDGPIWERIMVPRRRAPDPLLLRSHPPTAQRTRRLRALIPSQQRERLGHQEPVPPADYPEITRPARLRVPGIRW